jgi:hypothetical protein
LRADAAAAALNSERRETCIEFFLYVTLAM